MREDLMAYVLGELDEQTRSEIERELAADPSLRAEVERIRRCLSGDVAPQDCDCDDIPEGLADRIAHDIPHWASSQSSKREDDRRRSPSRSEYATGACNFTMVDMTVAMGVLLAIGSLLMPGLNTSRSDSQRLACQNNLRELGVLFTHYSNDHDNFMPLVAPNEHAGVYSLRLADANLASQQMIGQLVVCPSSPLAYQLRREGIPLVIPTWEEFRSAKGEELLRIRRTSGGSYANKVGYKQNGQYMPPRHLGLGWIPVLSDAPSITSGRHTGANHGGTTINTLFQDGSVQPLQTCVVSHNHDHIFLNEQGEPFAGDSLHDTVMCPSHGMPTMTPMELPWRIRIRFTGF
jgi:prepilin-type processing-associated H-X9-DG protein